MSALSQASIMPFQVGETYFQGATPPDAVTGVEWEGREFVVEDLNYSKSGGAQIFAPRAYGNQVAYKTVRIVRNVSGITLVPRQLVTFKLAAYGRQVDGLACTTSADCYPVDEFLNSTTGVPNNDLFYIVIEGPAEVLTDRAAVAGNVLVAGSSIVVAQTAATSQATTAGRITLVDVSGNNSTGSPVLNAALFRVGMALSARTTANTDTATLVQIFKRI